jgi:hypothetical protein
VTSTLEAAEITPSVIARLIAEGHIQRIRSEDGTEAVLVPGGIWDALASELEDILDEQDEELAAQIAEAEAEPPLDYARVREALGLGR